MAICINLCEMSKLFTSMYWYSFLIFVGILFVSHTIIDYSTSRITSKLYKENKIRSFFDVIGFDQYLHYLTIFIPYSLLYT